jgi:hypothetical protein
MKANGDFASNIREDAKRAGFERRVDNTSQTLKREAKKRFLTKNCEKIAGLW